MIQRESINEEPEIELEARKHKGSISWRNLKTRTIYKAQSLE